MAAPPAPENEPYFQGPVVPSPTPKDVFPGAGEMLQYPAPVVGAGYICTRPCKKNRALLEIVSVVVCIFSGTRQIRFLPGVIQKTLGKEFFAECLIFGTRQRREFAECSFYTQQRGLCRVYYFWHSAKQLYSC